MKMHNSLLLVALTLASSAAYGQNLFDSEEAHEALSERMREWNIECQTLGPTGAGVMTVIGNLAEGGCSTIIAICNPYDTACAIKGEFDRGTKVADNLCGNINGGAATGPEKCLMGGFAVIGGLKCAEQFGGLTMEGEERDADPIGGCVTFGNMFCTLAAPCSKLTSVCGKGGCRPSVVANAADDAADAATPEVYNICKDYYDPDSEIRLVPRFDVDIDKITSFCQPEVCRQLVDQKLDLIDAGAPIKPLKIIKGPDGQYRLYDGHHTYTACVQKGIKTCPALYFADGPLRDGLMIPSKVFDKCNVVDRFTPGLGNGGRPDLAGPPPPPTGGR